jgi:hypothetical protein
VRALLGHSWPMIYGLNTTWPSWFLVGVYGTGSGNSNASAGSLADPLLKLSRRALVGPHRVPGYLDNR